ncbi:cytochrome P450 [Streptomyces spiralis]|uniref:cytochrome P450 n=1 Tax=Streptomyces spiralis TaxID=66376 RepID=UPI0033E46DCD
MLTRYEDVRAALADETNFSSSGSLLATTLAPEVRALLGPYAELPSFAANNDPPTHTRLRRSVSRAFTPRAVTALHDLFVTEAHRVIDRFAAHGEIDIKESFAHVLPVKVTAALIGVPAADELRVKAWVENWFQLFRTPATPQRQMELARDFLGYVEYVRSLLEQRRHEPRDDFISQMATAAHGEHTPITAEELVEVVASLLLGGNETVSSLLTAAIRRLVGTKGLWDKIVADRSLVPTAIEEVLRIDGASLGDYRFTTSDVEFAGTRIPGGSRVIAYRDAANHDESVFAHPEVFDIGRPNVRMHLAFGHGIHHCVGAALARAETAAAVNVLADRLPNLRLVPGEPLRYRHAVLNRSLLNLRVRWDAKAAAAMTTRTVPA